VNTPSINPMNRPLRHVAIAALVMFAALLINSNVVQVGEASSLRANPHDVRVLYGEYSRDRGPIVVAGKDIARSVATTDTLKYLRTYPGGAAYAPVSGYYSLVIGASGIEQAEDPILSGSDDRLFLHRISDEITGKTPSGGSVVLTLNPPPRPRRTRDCRASAARLSQWTRRPERSSHSRRHRPTTRRCCHLTTRRRSPATTTGCCTRRAIH
jgi:hypothetical protein